MRGRSLETSKQNSGLPKVEKDKKIILTYGTFDLFHIGHVRLLKRLKALGEYLIVGVSTDEFNAKKGKRCLIPYAQRAEIVASSQFVDQVIPEHDWSQKKTDIITYAVDIFSMGDDWQGQFDELKAFCSVQYLPRTTDISTTEIKQLLTEFDSKKIEKIKNALDLLQEISKDFS